MFVSIKCDQSCGVFPAGLEPLSAVIGPQHRPNQEVHIQKLKYNSIVLYKEVI